MTDEKIEQRLAGLRDEFAKGKQMLIDLERESNEVREGLLRLAGAIQVLEELEAERVSSGDPASD